MVLADVPDDSHLLHNGYGNPESKSPYFLLPNSCRCDLFSAWFLGQLMASGVDFIPDDPILLLVGQRSLSWKRTLERRIYGLP